MPIEVKWFDEEETLLLIEPANPWGWPDFYVAINQAQTMIRSKNHTVDVIFDLAGDFRLPNASLLSPLRSVYTASPENVGNRILVGANLFIEQVVSIATRAMGGGSTFHFVRTMEDALTLRKLESTNQPFFFDGEMLAD